MKKLFYPIIFLLIILNFNISYAQAPQSFKYQAVVRNSSGNIIANSPVRFRMSILQGSTGGPSVYVETQYVTTNQFGLVDFAIGSGTYVSGNFSTISWGTNTYYLKVELDPAGGTTYTLLGTTQLLSVPYALYAGSAGGGLWTANGNNIFNNNTGNVGIGTTTPTSKLVIKQTTTNINDTLFVVKDNSGNPVFAVFPQGVRVFVPDLVTGTVGGFAVSGRGSTKGNGNYLLVNHDSTRVYTNDTVKGFGISDISGTTSNYLHINPANYKIGINAGRVLIVNGVNKYNLFIGHEAGYNMLHGRDNTFIGYRAGYNATQNTAAPWTGISNVYIGSKAGLFNVYGAQNVIIGTNAGAGSAIFSSSDNVIVGSYAGNAAIGPNNVVIGSSATIGAGNTGNVVLGYQAITSGNYGLAIGQYSGYLSNSDTSIFLGFCAGRYETNNSRLYISNKWVTSHADALTKALIYGEFDNKILRFNASVGIGKAPLYQLELSLNSAAKPTSSTWIITSDIRVKDVKGKYEKGLKDILMLDPIVYRYKMDNVLGIAETDKDAYGFSAQDVQKIFPEAVGTNDKGYLNLDMHPILIAEINAFKELNSSISLQQKQIEQLQKENDALKKDNETLKNKVTEIDELKKDIEILKKKAGLIK